MKEEELEVAIDIMQRKIALFIRNNKEKDITVFKNELQKLLEEEDKIYELDEKTIQKVFTIYLEELKKEKENKNE